MKAVALVDGRLTEVEVPELAVFRRQGFTWQTLKSATTVSRVGSTLTYLASGWYIENEDAVQRTQGETVSLSFFPRTRRILGPF